MCRLVGLVLPPLTGSAACHMVSDIHTCGRDDVCEWRGSLADRRPASECRAVSVPDGVNTAALRDLGSPQVGEKWPRPTELAAVDLSLGDRVGLTVPQMEAERMKRQSMRGNSGSPMWHTAPLPRPWEPLDPAAPDVGGSGMVAVLSRLRSLYSTLPGTGRVVAASAAKVRPAAFSVTSRK